MNHIPYQTLFRPILNNYIKKLVPIRGRQNSCQEPNEDCCGNPINRRVAKVDVVIEKDCTPCYFYTWKPKIPKLNCVKKKPKVPKSFEKKKCYAGMTSGKKTLEELKKEANECYKSCAIKPGCPETFKMLKHLENDEQLKNQKNNFGRCLPVADWDHDGDMY